MHAHIPDDGLHTQLGVLADCIARALVELEATLALPPSHVFAAALRSRIAALNLLCRTFAVLTGNFEQASGQAISAIARLESAGLITAAAADELMRPFEQALGEMYVSTMAAQPE